MKKRPLPANTKRFSDIATKVFEGVRFDTYQWQQEEFNGTSTTYEIVKRADTVIVIPFIDDEIILVKEQQPHWDAAGYNLVAGMVNHEEDLRIAAQRELEEETGMIFKHYHLVHIEEVVPSIEWFAYTFIAIGYLGEKKKKLDAGEKNEVVRIPIDKLINMTRNRELFYRPRFIEDLIVQDKIEQLKDIAHDPAKYELKVDY